MDGIRYHASRPADCRHCFFWKNRKKGCVLGKENCYYLIEPPKGPSKCEGCPYKRAKPCVLVPCYKGLMAPLEKRGDAKWATSETKLCAIFSTPCTMWSPLAKVLTVPRTAASCVRTIGPISSSAPACMPTALIRSRSMYSVPHLKNGIWFWERLSFLWSILQSYCWWYRLLQ